MWGDAGEMGFIWEDINFMDCAESPSYSSGDCPTMAAILLINITNEKDYYIVFFSTLEEHSQLC